MSERKTATTIDEQLDRLQDRGMAIGDIDDTRKVLSRVGYFRMGFYWYRFEIPEYRRRGIHRFRRDTTWEKVEALYNFDDRFRNLLSFYLQTIETDIRTRITYIASNHYRTDPFWFVNPSYVGAAFISEFCAGYSKLRRNNDVIRKHHRKHPEDTYAPAWKTLEFLTFGEIQHLYLSILEEPLRLQIFSRYNIVEEDVFKSYIDIMRIIRNVCAHSHILYDKRLYDGIVGRHELLGLNTGEEFSIVGILKLIYYMLRQIDPDKETEMRNNLRTLVNQVEYDSVRFAISRLAF
ncbi:MAG: Abi family protein [Paludibacteraceae bacterium]|nr:Abi family protein [Paludibacteraceae bacterium]